MTSDATPAGDIEARLRLVERRLRAMTRLAAAALSLGLFLLLVQVFEAIAPAAPTLEADAFVLRDVDGVERVRLSQEGEGPPGLLFSDAQGRTRASISLAADGMPSLLMRDDRGKVRAGLALLPDQRPQFALLGEGPPQVLLGITAPTADGSGGEGRLTLRDHAGTNRFEAP